jgi:uncharacterized protein (TIGR00369 family)
MSSLNPSSYTRNLTYSVNTTPIHTTLGVKLVSQSLSPTGIPTAKLQFTSSSIHLTPTRTVHGGISSLLIDSACFLAIIPTLSDGESAATIASSFQVLDAVPDEGKLYEVEGRVVRRGKKVVFCEGEVRCGERLIAKGNLTKLVTKEKSKL